jgi:RNA polymerase sigma-70 factor, ECF subfamily
MLLVFTHHRTGSAFIKMTTRNAIVCMNNRSAHIFEFPGDSSRRATALVTNSARFERPSTLDVSFTTSSFDVLIRDFRKMAKPITTETADAELVALAQTGDLDAFEALTNRHERRVYSLALRMLRQEQDAEDVTQQTFLSALENVGRFRGDASFSTWLLRIASHAALKVIRKRKGLDTVSLEEATEETDHYDTIPHPEYIADWRQSPEELVHKNETKRLLDDALAKLDDKHRLVFLLRDVEGLSVKEAAEALGLSEANTKVRLLRARLQLREELTRTLGDPERRVSRTAHAH